MFVFSGLEILCLLILLIVILGWTGFWLWVGHQGDHAAKAAVTQTSHEIQVYLFNGMAIPLEQIGSIDAEVARGEIILRKNKVRIEFHGQLVIR